MTEIGGANPEFAVTVPDRPDAIVRLTWAAGTDTGYRRSANEDSYLAISPLFVVADGMGGHSAGDLASAAVVERLAEVATTDFIAARTIERALEQATDDISVIAGDSVIGVGTTVTGAALTTQEGDPYFAVFNIGDSRVYRLLDGEFSQVTVDHSVVQELVESGTLTRAEAENHPDSNIITRAVGFGAPPIADFWMLPVRAGMRLLVCSDGLTKELDDDAIQAELVADRPADETVHSLIDAALAAGGRDNVTLIVVTVVEAPDMVDLEDTAPRHPVL